MSSEITKNIGVLGAGQLGRMLALAGYPLGNRFTFLDTTGNPSAGIGEVIVDPNNQHLAEFLAKVDVVTYEFDPLPVELVREIEQQKRMQFHVKHLAREFLNRAKEEYGKKGVHAK